jgi:hypothetical protein
MYIIVINIAFPPATTMDLFQREDDAAKWRHNNGIARVDR